MHAPDTPIPADAPGTLTPAQLQAASLLAAGQSPAAAAQALSIHRATLHRWRQEPVFAVHLHQLLQEVAEETAARAGQLALQALAHLEKQFNNPTTPPDLRTKLAFRILSLYSRPNALKHLAATPMRQNATPCDTPQPPSGTKYQAPLAPCNAQPITNNKEPITNPPMRQNATSCDTPVTQYALRNTPSLPATSCNTPQPPSRTKYQAPSTPCNPQPTTNNKEPITKNTPPRCLACAVAAVPLA